MAMVNTSYGADINDKHLREKVFKNTIFMNADYPTSYPFTEIVQQIHNSKKRGYHQKDDSFPHSLFGLVLNNPIENKFDLNTLNTSPYNSILCTPFNDEAKDVAQKTMYFI